MSEFFIPVPQDVAGRADSDKSLAPIAARRTNGFMYWALILMALAVLAPCILLPEWRQLEQLELARQKAQHHVDLVNAAIDRERRTLDAIRTDPVAVERLAKRELAMRRLDEATVFVPVEQAPPTDDAVFNPQPLAPPEPIAKLVRRMPELNYDALFCEKRTRTLLIAMSTGLIVVAVALFGQPRKIVYSDDSD